MLKSIFFLFCLCFSLQMWSQPVTQEQLEERKAKIQSEIKEKEQLLKSVKSKEKTVVTQLQLQKEKIGLKEKLIKTTEKQATILDNDIYSNQKKINLLKRQLKQLKLDYASMILKSYKNASVQSRAMFLLSSDNFLQAYKRLQYMKQYSSYRKMQGREISDKTKQLVGYTKKIVVKKSEKEILIQENEKEKQALVIEKQEQEKIAVQLQKEKGKIVADIKKKQQETKKIDAQIQKLIKEAIAAANKKTAAEKAKANPKTTTPESTKALETATKIVLTSEGQLVANNFKANKGKLPWPVEKGVISLPYGDQPHPTFKSLVVHNSGIEITTDSGSSARSVFGGEVTKVIKLSPLNIAVFIQHGDYFTVYQNLSSVSVSVGDKVAIKQNLGKIRTNGDTGKTILKFLILQNTNYNNPATWLFR